MVSLLIKSVTTARHQRLYLDLLRFPADNFLLIVKSILWGMQHPGHDISNNALETCSVLLQRIGELEDEDQQNDLYTVVYMTILQAVIRLINDRDRRTRKYLFIPGVSGWYLTSDSIDFRIRASKWTLSSVAWSRPARVHLYQIVSWQRFWIKCCLCSRVHSRRIV